MTNAEAPETLELNTYVRKPFEVEAVQITVGNVYGVAKWCNGTVELTGYKVLGSKTMLPCIKLEGNGPQKGKMVTALLNHWIVRQDENFRVYRQHSFKEAFDQKSDGGFVKGDWVHVVNPEHAAYEWLGEVKKFGDGGVMVDFESHQMWGVRFRKDEIKKWVKPEA